MAAVGKGSGKDRPNLKICIDNTDNPSESEESTDESELEEDSSVEDEAKVQIRVTDETEEEGELQLTVEEFSGTRFQDNTKKYKNKAGDFITGIDIASKESEAKRLERAKRFGIKTPPKHTCTAVELHKLYASLGFSEAQLKKNERGIRLEAIHMRGVDKMNTKDIFDYFKNFSPGNVEWIDDTSCNVIWFDKTTAARALLALTFDPENSETETETEYEEEKKPDIAKVDTVQKDRKDMDVDEKKENKNGEEQSEDEDELNLVSDDEEDKKDKKQKSHEEQDPQDEKMEEADTKCDSESLNGGRPHQQSDSDKEEGEVMDTDDEQQSEKKTSKKKKCIHEDIPPGKWRIGHPDPKANTLFFRYATKADKKLPGAEKRSKYYQHFGNPNYGGIKGLLSENRKRKYRSERYRGQREEAHEAVVRHKRPTIQHEEAEILPEIEEWGVGVNTTTEITPTYNVLRRFSQQNDPSEQIGDGDYFTDSLPDTTSHQTHMDYNRANWRSEGLDSGKPHWRSERLGSSRHHWKSEGVFSKRASRTGVFGRLSLRRDSNDSPERKKDSEQDSGSEDSEDLEEEVEKLLAPTQPKRTMRMYADDLEDESKAKRSTIEAAKDARRKLHARKLGRRLEQEEDFRRRKGQWREDSEDDADDNDNEEEIPVTLGDLRSKLKSRKDESSIMKRIKIQVDAW